MKGQYGALIASWSRKTTCILLLATFSCQFLSSQASSSDDLPFEVNRVQLPYALSKRTLTEANTISDLNMHYKDSWIKEYDRVEISTYHNGQIKKALSKDHVLSQEQKLNIEMADVSSNISVKVNYIPNNSLKHNDQKEIEFDISIYPATDAKFPGGEKELMKYLKENAIDNIPPEKFKNYDLAVIKFTINEIGEIAETEVFGSEFHSSNISRIEDLLLLTVRNMPAWDPARYGNGDPVKQEFALTVGNMKSCVIPLLNTQDLD